MSTAKYKVFNDGGLQALVNQTKANKIAAGDNSAAIDGLTSDLQEMSAQVAGVFGEVENCLNELDTVKADTASVNEALGKKSDVEHTHNYAGSSSAGGAATSANKLETPRTISLTGDVTGSGSFDGSENLSITATLGDIDCGTF